MSRQFIGNKTDHCFRADITECNSATCITLLPLEKYYDVSAIARNTNNLTITPGSAHKAWSCDKVKALWSMYQATSGMLALGLWHHSALTLELGSHIHQYMSEARVHHDGKARLLPA